MGQTLSEQILSHSAGRPVQAGELVVVAPDVAMGHDSLTPSIITIMQDELGVPRVHNPEQIVLVIDHVSPASTVGTAIGLSTDLATGVALLWRRLGLIEDSGAPTRRVDHARCADVVRRGSRRGTGHHGGGGEQRAAAGAPSN